jgi:hypothetical protein
MKKKKKEREKKEKKKKEVPYFTWKLEMKKFNKS